MQHRHTTAVFETAVGVLVYAGGSRRAGHPSGGESVGFALESIDAAR